MPEGMESAKIAAIAQESAKQITTRVELPPDPEHSEKDRARETLTELGLFIPVSSLETYHGRVKKSDELWAVDPTFNNAGDATGNNNVNVRSTLYTSDERTASEFARERATQVFFDEHREGLKEQVKHYSQHEKQDWLERLNTNSALHQFTMEDIEEGSFYYHSTLLREARELAQRIVNDGTYIDYDLPSDVVPDVHEIVTTDPHALIIDVRFDRNNLHDSVRPTYIQALQALALPIDSGSPARFEDRDQIGLVLEAMQQDPKKVISADVIGDIAQSTGVDATVVRQLASAYNSRQLALVDPSYLADKALRYPTNICSEDMDLNGVKMKVPFNLEYAERYMRENRIVGIKQRVSSVTLGKNITSTSFFDLHRTGTREQIDRQKEVMTEQMGGLIDSFPPFPTEELTPDQGRFFEELEKPYTKPEDLVALAKEVGDFKDIFKSIYESDAGNWEGYTLEEHTETVLRNFEENYADTIPVEYLAPMRLAFLVHDLGKPQAVSHGDKEKQKTYNRFYARNFLNELGIDHRLRDLITAIVTDGGELAFRLQRKPEDAGNQTRMKTYAEDVLSQYLGKDAIDTTEIRAFTEMCKLFQVCDGGAYTSMAVTRRSDKGTYRNYPSFNDSFEKPAGLGKRDIRYKK